MASAAATTAAASSGTVSLPLLAVAEAKSHSVVVETRDGRSYRGVLLSIDIHSGNITLGNNICTDASGYKTSMNHTTIKGSEVTVVQLPSVIKNAPFLKSDFIRSVKEKVKITSGNAAAQAAHARAKATVATRSSKLTQRTARRLAEGGGSADGAAGEPERAGAGAGAGRGSSRGGRGGRGGGNHRGYGRGGSSEGSRGAGLSNAFELSRRMKEARKGPSARTTAGVKRK